MRITRKTIRQANAAMAAAADNPDLLPHKRGDVIRNIWEPLAEALIDSPFPKNREAEIKALGSDYLGTTVEGDLVAWGREHPEWHEFTLC